MAPVIEKYKLPPIQIFDKNCPLKRVNQSLQFFDKMYVNWNFFGNIRQKIYAYWCIEAARAAPLAKKRQYLA